jgi:hypothetical protein
MASQMSIDRLFDDELREPTAAIAYRISRRLAECFAGKYVLEAKDQPFDLLEFAADGHCSASLRTESHNQLLTDWEGRGEGLSIAPATAHYLVRYRDQSLQVITSGWPQGVYHNVRWHWIVADSQDIAEQFLQEACEWCNEVRGEVLVFSDGCWHKSAALFASIHGVNLDSLVLRGDLKDTIRSDFERFVASRASYLKYSVPWKRGVLFVGPPGNGKTHCVKALINHLGLPCLYVQSFKAQHATDHHCIQAVFHRARQTSPCVLVLEDLDSLITGDNRSFFLNELDGFAANQGIITLATTNHPERLDPAILDRPSRFDMKYHFELPGFDERRDYLGLWNDRLVGEMRLTAEELKAVAEATDGFSFAYLKELILSSIMRWMTAQASGSMPAVMSEQVGNLRQQMRFEPAPPRPLANPGDLAEDD